LNIDIHAHFVPQSLLDELVAGKHAFPSVKTTGAKDTIRIAFNQEEPKRPVLMAMSDIALRKRALEEQHIDRQVVAGWVDLFGYSLPAAEGADWARYLNEHMLKGVKELDRFVPLATVPMQSGKLAARVLEDALNAGFHGAMIATQPSGPSSGLDDPDLNPFWEVAHARRATIFVHPTFGVCDDRLKAYGLVNALGRITDSTIAMSRLLYSGHLLRYPDMNMVVAHGGAALPMAIGRLRSSHAGGAAGRADPVEGFNKLYFDSVVYDTQTLRFVCDKAGSDKVMMGTDQPFGNAQKDPVQFIQSCCGVGTAESQLILGETAARVFRIPAEKRNT
jgi:aminocarboxymuconate-semialdehyde decarboxylase